MPAGGLHQHLQTVQSSPARGSPCGALMARGMHSGCCAAWRRLCAVTLQTPLLCILACIRATDLLSCALEQTPLLQVMCKRPIDTWMVAKESAHTTEHACSWAAWDTQAHQHVRHGCRMPHVPQQVQFTAVCHTKSQKKPDIYQQTLGKHVHCHARSMHASPALHYSPCCAVHQISSCCM